MTADAFLAVPSIVGRGKQALQHDDNSMHAPDQRHSHHVPIQQEDSTCPASVVAVVDLTSRSLFSTVALELALMVARE